MQILHGRVGEFETRIGPHEMTLREMVTLAQPPAAGSQIRVFLRGFDIGYDNADRNLKRVRVELEAYSFGNSTEVEVIARIALQDKDPDGGGVLSPGAEEPIRAEVFYTVLAE